MCYRQGNCITEKILLAAFSNHNCFPLFLQEITVKYAESFGHTPRTCVIGDDWRFLLEINRNLVNTEFARGCFRPCLTINYHLKPVRYCIFHRPII